MDKIQMAKGKLARGPLPAMFNSEHYQQVGAFHQTLKQYAPTPLINLSKLAEKLGIQAILVKDESHRFGLNAFKALGASYAVHRYLEQHPHTVSHPYRSRKFLSLSCRNRSMEPML